MPIYMKFEGVDGDEPELLDVDLLELPAGDHAPYLVVPKAPLVPGAKYVLWDATTCDSWATAPTLSDTPLANARSCSVMKAMREPPFEIDRLPTSGASRTAPLYIGCRATRQSV